MRIQENVPLSKYTTFKVGGPAKYFCRAKSIEDLFSACRFAKEKNCPIFALGAGSNVVVSSNGFDGLVVQIGLDSIELDGRVIRAGSGCQMSDLVERAAEAGLAGLEWAGGLPGTFGGAIRGNAGAFGGEIKDNLLSVTAFSTQTGEIKIFTNAECKFEYRGSYFKRNRNWVILQAELLLTVGDREKLRSIVNEHIEFRRIRHPLEYPNAGSMFKNVPVESIPPQTMKLFQEFIKVDPFPVVPAGKIIQDAGLKGYQIGGARVSEKHCNYIVNKGNASGEDIYQLTEKIKEQVAGKFGIKLETEPEFLGFKS
jgi:UDP-N-acetylmuramate dehydrogenase